MIEVDLVELERLTDTLAAASSSTEDLVGRMHSLGVEMQANPELLTYPQSTPVLEMLSSAETRAVRLSETLITLKTLIAEAVEDYKAQEDEFLKELDGALSSISALSVSIGAAQAAQMLVIETDTETFAQNRVQELVAQDHAEMEMTSLAAVSKVIEEEYGVTAVHSDARLAQELEDAAGETEMSALAASAIRIEDDEEELLKKGFAEQAANDREEMDTAAALAEKIAVSAPEDPV